MNRKLVVAVAILALSACVRPKPEPPKPPPGPPGNVCEAGQTSCCWHQPPGNDWLYACKAPNFPGGVLDVAGGPAQCPNASCGSTPPPDGVDGGTPLDPGKLLRLGGPTGWMTNDGVSIKPFGVEACCDSWAKCPDDAGTPAGTGWPGISACFVSESAKYGANIFHFRIGPWNAKCADWNNSDCGEPYWAGIGGAYNADGSWNEAYWAKVLELLVQVHQGGGWTEVVPVDDWWLKGACGKDKSCNKQVPWSHEAVMAWGKTWHPEHDALYRKTVETVGCLGSVIWATGNEEDLIPGATSEHMQARVTALRKYEQEVGCGFVHLIGTGSFKPGIGADYQITHENAPVDGPCNGRPCVNNEHNPNVSVAEEAARFKQALDAKQRYDAWRAVANDEDWEARLRLFQGIVGGGAPPVGCYAPPQVPEEKWQTLGPGPGDRNDEIRAGQAELGSLCAEPKHHDNGDRAIEALAQKMRDMGYCASKHSDSVTIQSEDDPSVWLEYHAVAPYDTGCWSQRPQDYPHNRHRYLGATTPPPAAECPITVPTVDEVLCKLHQPGQGLYDCTPKANGQPILPEGHPDRPACEKAAMGGAYPTYRLGQEPPSALTLSTVENPMMFRIQGSGSGFVTCVTPSSAGKNVCKGGDTSLEQGVPVAR
ncbi:MAG TPA: hypothetical protein VI589_06970 [Vicinamibacteria bacterium]